MEAKVTIFESDKEVTAQAAAPENTDEINGLINTLMILGITPVNFIKHKIFA